MITLSLDASTTCIGWSVFDEDNLIAFGKITPTEKKLEWRDRLQNLIPQLHKVIQQYKPVLVYAEDVPLIRSKSMSTLVVLGAVQGAIIGICLSHNVRVEFIPVSTWRKNIGLHDGTKEGKERNVLKQHSIEKANALFNLNLLFISLSSNKNDDDISDSILLYASTRDKYKVSQTKYFTRKK